MVVYFKDESMVVYIKLGVFLFELILCMFKHKLFLWLK